MSNNHLPEELQGLKIHNFKTLLPGPCYKMIMADLGAGVLRVLFSLRLDASIFNFILFSLLVFCH